MLILAEPSLFIPIARAHERKTRYLVLSNLLITGLVIVDLAHLTGSISLNPGMLTLANIIMLVIAYTAYKLMKRIDKKNKGV